MMSTVIDDGGMMMVMVIDTMFGFYGIHFGASFPRHCFVMIFQ